MLFVVGDLDEDETVLAYPPERLLQGQGLQNATCQSVPSDFRRIEGTRAGRAGIKILITLTHTQCDHRERVNIGFHGHVALTTGQEFWSQVARCGREARARLVGHVEKFRSAKIT